LTIANYADLRAKRDYEVEEAKRFLGRFPDVRLSYWSFSNYKTCPQRYILQARPKKVYPKRDAYWALQGATVHSLWEDFTKGVRAGNHEWSDREFLSDNIAPYYDKVVKEEYVDWGVHGVPPDEHRKSALPEIFDSINFVFDTLESEGFIPCDPASIHTELKFTTRFTPDITLTGRVDLVFERPDRFHIVDFKDIADRSRVDWRQLIWYVFGLEPQFGKPVGQVGFLLTKLREWSWRNPNAKDYRAKLRAEILNTALKIRREPFPAIVSRHHCTWCDVQKQCPEYQSYAGRSNEILNTIAILEEGFVEI
jgi:hypothetical protein